MPTNLELKARYEHNRKLSAGIQKLNAMNAGTLLQKDTYFYYRPGRLKLREIENERSELIWYRRPNSVQNRYSVFKRISVEDPGSLKRILAASIGVKTVVKKKRQLYLFRNSRIHVDKVEKLGTFIEFEVMVTKGRNQAKSLLLFLEKAFNIAPRSVLVSSYGDMMNRHRRNR